MKKKKTKTTHLNLPPFSAAAASILHCSLDKNNTTNAVVKCHCCVRHSAHKTCCKKPENVYACRVLYGFSEYDIHMI